jgi:GNAT superfamily N-acetyltransferase
MIRFARENEVEILKGLYMSCFEDSEAFARALFSRLFKPENCLVREEDGQPVAMLFLINPLKEVGYIYGACTRADMRGRGIMSALVLRAEDEMRARGYKLSILIPGSARLFKFYDKLGYKTGFYKHTGTYDAKPCDVPAVRVGGDEIKNLLYSTIGGGYFGTERGRALVEKGGGKVTVRELDGDETVLDAVAAAFGVKTLNLNLPSNDQADPPRGMVKVLEGKPDIARMLSGIGALYD